MRGAVSLRVACRREDIVTSPNCLRLVSISAAAVLTGIDSRVIYRWIRAGRVPAWGFRGAMRVNIDDLLPKYEPALRAPVSARKQGANRQRET